MFRLNPCYYFTDGFCKLTGLILIRDMRGAVPGKKAAGKYSVALCAGKPPFFCFHISERLDCQGDIYTKGLLVKKQASFYSALL